MLMQKGRCSADSSHSSTMRMVRWQSTSVAARRHDFGWRFVGCIRDTIPIFGSVSQSKKKLPSTLQMASYLNEQYVLVCVCV